MIRFLQKDTRITKIIFGVIIGVTCILMVIFLVPGIFSGTASSSTTYASIRHGGILGRFLPAQDSVSVQDVQDVATSMMQGQQIPSALMPMLMQEASQQVIQQRILLDEAHKLGIRATNADVRNYLHSGVWGEYLFPDGKFIGTQAYAQFISDNFHISTMKFENEVREQIVADRLRDLVTAGATVSDKAVRDYYRNKATKVQFKYAVLSTDKLRKTINPTDTELQAFFQQNAARYKDADPETRTVAYVDFTDKDLPGGAPQVADSVIQQYYNQNQQQYKVDAEVKVRHILISVNANATPAAVAQAKAKAEKILKEVQADHGKNFAALAKKYSDDPGSKTQGGELGWIKHGATVPSFDKAAFALQPSQISGLVHTRYGFHIIKCQAKQEAHIKPLSEVKDAIVAILTKQQEQQEAVAYARQLANEAQQTSLDKVAAAHHLKVTTANGLTTSSTLPNLADSSKLISQAFTTKENAAPQVADTGSGTYAVFQVKSIAPAHTPTFAEYKSHVLDDYRDQQVTQLLARKTQELADRAHAEDSLTKAAKEVGATIETSGLVGRTDQVPDIGQLSSTAPSLFDLQVGQISKAINTGNTGVVAKLTDKQLPSQAEIEQNFASTRETLLNQRRDQLYEVFVSNLVNRYQKAGRILVNRKMAQNPPPLSGS